MNLLFKIFDFFVYLVSLVSKFDIVVYLLVSFLVTCIVVFCLRKVIKRG